VAAHVRQVQARWCACQPDAAAAIARVGGPGARTPRASPTSLAVSRGPLSHGARHTPPAPCPSRPASEAGPTTARVRLSCGGRG
jgi:hypothetical protein